MPHAPFTLGSFDVTPLCDGWAPLPLDDEAPGQDVDWDAQRSLFPWAFPPNFILAGRASLAATSTGRP